MDKTTFSLQYDPELQIAYIKKVKDEMTKNHRDKDTEITTGFMPQVLVQMESLIKCVQLEVTKITSTISVPNVKISDKNP